MPIFDKLRGTQADSFIVNSKSVAGDDAALQVDSKERGFLPPRMTTAQKTAIASPSDGLVVYDTTIGCLSVYRAAVGWRCILDAPRGSIWVGITTGLTAGDFVYISANNTATLTDARDLVKSRCAGAYYGEAARVQDTGVIDAAKFSLASSTPLPGYPVYLAKADDELGDGAAGKLTADEPDTGFPAEVGLVISVNPILFPTTRVAKILLQIKKIIREPRIGVAPTGLIDGSNTTFTTPSYFRPNSLALYFNGQRMIEGSGNDYTISESGGAGTGYDTITTVFVPRGAPGNPDKLIVDYWEV